MAKLSDIVRGLQIIQRYCKEGAHLSGAEHDVIYAPRLERPLLSDDERELEALGWHTDDENDLWCHYC
jgi:hypothetical protein